jgi:hypothetical protein
LIAEIVLESYLTVQIELVSILVLQQVRVDWKLLEALVVVNSMAEKMLLEHIHQNQNLELLKVVNHHVNQ